MADKDPKDPNTPPDGQETVTPPQPGTPDAKASTPPPPPPNHNPTEIQPGGRFKVGDTFVDAEGRPLEQ